MTLRKIIKRVSMGVQRDDLEDSYKDFVHEAIRELEKLRDWSWSHTTAELVWTQGADRMRMPKDFKAFGEIPAAFVFDTSASPATQWPVLLEHRSKFFNSVRGGPYFGNSANNGVQSTGCWVPRAQFPMWYDYLDGFGTVGLNGPTTQPLSFEVSYYRYQPTLEADDDENPFTINEPLMVIARAKAVAFSSINDPMTVGCLQEVDYLYKLAEARDERIRLAGVRLRMRG